MDSMEIVIVVMAGLALICLGGARIEAIQHYAAGRCQRLQIELQQSPPDWPERIPTGGCRAADR